MSDDRVQFRLAYLLLAGLVLVRFLPLVVGTRWLWGFSQLTLLPFSFVIAFGLVGLLILILPLLPREETWGRSLTTWFSQVFYDSSSKYGARGLVLLAAAAVFVSFRMPTHFLGDGYSLIANVGSTAGHWVKWSERGAMAVILGAQFLVGAKSESSALLAYQIVAVISGLFTIWFYFLIARVMSYEPAKRLLVFTTLLFASSVLLFFGYVESYPIFWAPVSAFLYFGLKYAIEGEGALPAVICLFAATAIHLQAGMYFPAMGVLLLSRGAGLRFYQKFRLYVLVGIGIAVTVGVILFWKAYSNNLAVENVFLYPFSGKPISPDYSIFCARHLSDILNLFLLMYPLGLVILVLAWQGSQNWLREPSSVFLGLLAVGSLLFLVLIDTGLSLPRDWDLFGICWFAPALLLIHRVPGTQISLLRRLAIPMSAASLLLILPFLVANLSEEYGLAEIRQIIANNPDKSFGSMTLLGTYYQRKGDLKSAEECLRLKRQMYPDFFRIKDAFQLLVDGRREDAYRLFQQARPDKFSMDYHSFLAEYYLRGRSPDEALRHAQSAIQLQVYFDRNYALLAYAHLMKGDIDDGTKALREGYALNERNKEFLVGLAQVNFNLKFFDSTLCYAERLHQVDSTDPIYYYLCAKSYGATNDFPRAVESANNYSRLGRGSAGFSQNCDELRRILPPTN